ncbi:S9 family peptidase [Peristeroidobacter soli]|uniref:S9 family peptidase n=1 Tax=Peristeroidobacter soli TaxID=2497877 RepID=UPI00101BD6AE|nr:prolyl oligopeptidase family serine peptidase [Peristeroidobacter soli]
MRSLQHSSIAGVVLAVALSWSDAGASAPAFKANPADAFPIDLAFSMREFLYNQDLIGSPSGNQVAYVVITPPPTQPQSDRFLPNGTPITAIGASVHVVSTDASKPSQAPGICSGKGDQWAPSWSADGKQLAFYSNADGLVRVWTYELATQRCRRVSDAIIRGTVFSGSQPRWSPDGATLYVPLDPNPPKLSPTTASVVPAVEKRGPMVLFGGNEGGAELAARDGQSGSSDDWMMKQYGTALAAISVDGGAVRMLVPADHASRPHRLELSPSGKWVSYNSVLYLPQNITTASVMDLLAVPARGGEPKPLVKAMRSSEHNVNYTRLDYRWHPQQDRLFYLQDGGLWSVDFSDNGPSEPRRLAPELGELAPVVLYFTADAKSLVVGLEAQGEGRDRMPQRLAIVPLDGGPVVQRKLPDLKQWQFLDLIRADADSLWQPDARSVVAVMRERSTGEQAMVRVDVTSGETTVLAKGMYRTPFLAATGGQRQLVGVYEDIGTPPNVYRFTAKATRAQQLSNIEPKLDGRRHGTAEVIETRTPQHDGSLASVRTTILLPPGAKRGDRLPAIVMIYSGSDLSTRASVFGGGMGNTVPSQVFTSRGYAVVMANIVLAPEGVGSYPANQMTDEVLAQAYAAADAGYIDINRLAVSGQSYGGYSTGSIVSHTNLFRAAIPVNGCFDLAAFYGGMQDGGNSHWVRWAEKGQGRMGDSPWANPARFIDNSPYYRIDRIRTPLLIVAGEADETVAYQESKKFFVGLRRMDRPVQLVVYPGEGHVIATWSTVNAVDVSQRMVDFLDKHLRQP